MADFHAYEFTFSLAVAVPAAADGTAQALTTVSGLASAVQQAVQGRLDAQGISIAVGIPDVTMSDATPVTVP